MAKNAVKTNALGEKLTPDNFARDKRERSAQNQQQTQVVEEVVEAPVKETVAETPATVEQNPPMVEETKNEPVVAPAPEKGNLAAVYAEKTVIPNETRTKRIQVVVTPSIDASLNELVANRKIRSKNDLINFLLESYLSMVKEDK